MMIHLIIILFISAIFCNSSYSKGPNSYHIGLAYYVFKALCKLS